MMLVTGFGPYREDINASGELVSSLKKDLPDELRALGDQLVFEVIHCDDTSRETEHRSLEDQLATLLRTHKPDLCIFTGQAPPYNRITIEKIATNSFMREVIDLARPVAYWANLPGLDGLQSILEQHNIPAGYSFYAGQHLCNHILYSSLYFAEREQLAHRSGFVHVPVLPEQARKKYRDSPFMPIEMARMALSTTINHVFAEYRCNNS
jgi:pyroglutamyl-peptidase